MEQNEEDEDSFYGLIRNLCGILEPSEAEHRNATMVQQAPNSITIRRILNLLILEIDECPIGEPLQDESRKNTSVNGQKHVGSI